MGLDRVLEMLSALPGLSSERNHILRLYGTICWELRDEGRGKVVWWFGGERGVSNNRRATERKLMNLK